MPGTDVYDLTQFPWRYNPTTRLVVLIHGLNSSPLAWSKYLPALSNESTACFAPYVKNKAYCKVKEAAEPILEAVQDYAEMNPHNPIYLIGHSQGARIAAYIEQRLSVRQVHYISIAGPHYGTKLVNRLNAVNLSELFNLTPSIENELFYRGEWSTNKLIQWQNNCNAQISRLFFASPDDWRSSPIETSFPNLPNSQYFVVFRQSHVTIIDAVCNKVLAYIANGEGYEANA
jgi:pimeloyl-ACP methyl ester carboxylesterase